MFFIIEKNSAVPAQLENSLVNSSVDIAVDIALIKNITNFQSIKAINDLDSDHHPIIKTLSKTEITVKRRKFLNYKNADWDKYTNYITKHLNMEYKLPEKESINHAVATLTKTINEAAAAAIPLITAKTKPMKLLEEMEISNRNKIRRVYQKTRKRPYKILLNYFDKKIFKMIFSVANERWEKKVKSLSANDNSIWSMTKALTNENADNIQKHCMRTRAWFSQTKTKQKH